MNVVELLSHFVVTLGICSNIDIVAAHQSSCMSLNLHEFHCFFCLPKPVGHELGKGSQMNMFTKRIRNYERRNLSFNNPNLQDFFVLFGITGNQVISII